MTAAPRSGSRLVEFRSQGATLRGQLYEHAVGTPGPTVVMTHGFSATITGMVADRYAEVLHAAGLNVLLFDHRGFGLSGGEPRQVLNRWIQARGYRDALDFVTTLPVVDASRLAIWGDSMSASVALGVASFDERVRAVVVQVPGCGSEPPPPDPDGSGFRALRDTFLLADVESHPKETIGPMAVVSPDQIGSPSLLEPITAFRWFIDYGARPGTGWQNWATLVVADTPVPYHAGLVAPHLQGASLWVLAGDDEMPGAEPDVARMVFDAAPQPKELLEIGGGHFGLLYHPSPLFDQVSATQADFLLRHLGGRT
jgi:pimeloyl-ACP methyl ester carboxylesterase